MVCPVALPPLRARPNDARVLFNHFWKARGERRIVHEEVMRLLESHAWPGNVRELENLVERLSVCVEAPGITLATLPSDVRALLGGHPVGSSDLSFAFTAEGPVDAPIEMGQVEVATDGDMLSSRVAEAPSAPEMISAPMGLSTPEAPITAVPSLPMAALPMAAPLSFDAPISLDQPIDLPAMLKKLEDAYIDAALAKADGNRKSAADMLGLQRTTLVEKLRRRQRDNAPAQLPAESVAA
jgi:sigma-54 specific flagellar transcriptional regulator A